MPSTERQLCVRKIGWTYLTVIGTLLLSTGSAYGRDQGIPGRKLLLKLPAAFDVIARDPGISVAGSDPVGGADSSLTFDVGGGSVSFVLPTTHWSKNSSLFSYTNLDAPGPPSPVKRVEVKSGRLRVVGNGLPFPVPNGVATLRVVLSLDGGSNRYCMSFSGTGNGTIFRVGGSTAATCPTPPPTVTPTAPATASVTPSAPATATETPVVAAKPNIIVILTDDQRFDTVGTTHSLDGVTPVMPQVIDKLANEGVTFTNMYATMPFCTPSRTSILTGLYAHHTGVHANYIIPDSLQTHALPTWLHAQGYRTGFFGKYPQVRNVVPPPPGWDEWQAFGVIASFNYSLTNNGTLVSYGSTEPEYATDVLGQKTVQFIEATPLNQPIFCILATYAPHSEGLGFPVPAPRHMGMFSNVSPWRPMSYSEVDVSDKPMWMQALPLASDPFGSGFLFTHGEWTDVFRESQLEALQAVDEAVGNVVAAIEARGQSTDTAIIYTSDNGLLWGEHRLYYTKGQPYAESVRVPLIIRYPKLAAGHQVATQIALNIDLPATIADIVGTPPPYALDGTSLVPVLVDPVGASGRADFLFESPYPTNFNSVGIRTDDHWEYNRYATGEEELYNLANDPDELESVASDPANETLKSTLAVRLSQLQQ